MGTNECSQPASKSSWDSQDIGVANMVLKMAHFHESSRPQWVNNMYIVKYHSSNWMLHQRLNNSTDVSDRVTGHGLVKHQTQSKYLYCLQENIKQTEIESFAYS